MIADYVMKGAVFDVDGTILDTMGMWAGVADKYLLSFGIVPGEDLNGKFLSATIEESALMMKKKYGLVQSAEEIQEGIQKIVEDFYKNEAVLKPGILEVLQKIHSKGIPMIVASSGIRELIEVSFDRLGISEYFKCILTGDKKDVKIFEECISILKTDPLETFVFEDGLHAINTARKLGLKTVLVRDIQENYEDIRRVSDYALEEFVI